ncbi:MAG: DMT family transporter [Candidatus Eremiobacteraeota bacterium]|nr:DMT family transporter [Candidatus Eremiobacteraeota bacterium]
MIAAQAYVRRCHDVNLQLSRVPSSRALGYSLLLGAQLAVGAAAIFARYALAAAQPLAVAALRLLLAALILVGISAASGALRENVNRSARLVLIVAGIALAIHFATWIASLEYTTIAVSTLLVCTTPIWTSLYDAVVLKRRLPPAVWFAYCGGAVGLWLVVGGAGSTPPITGHQVFGAGLALAGSLAIGAYFILVRTVRAALATTTIVTWTYSWAAIALTIGALVTRQPAPPLHATGAWLGILAMALISQLLGHTAMNASLRWFSPSAIAMATLLEPIFAALLAAAIFAERLTAQAISGGIILLGAIAVVLFYESPPTPELKLD